MTNIAYPDQTVINSLIMICNVCLDTSNHYLGLIMYPIMYSVDSTLAGKVINTYLRASAGREASTRETNSSDL